MSEDLFGSPALTLACSLLALGLHLSFCEVAQFKTKSWRVIDLLILHPRRLLSSWKCIEFTSCSNELRNQIITCDMMAFFLSIKLFGLFVICALTGTLHYLDLSDNFR